MLIVLGYLIMSTPPKLILHFDVQHTVTVEDSTHALSAEEVINTYIAGVAWGRTNDVTGWARSSDQVSLTRTHNDDISFFEHIFLLAKKGKERHKTYLSDQLNHFTDLPVGRTFKKLLDETLESLNKSHADITQNNTSVDSTVKPFRDQVATTPNITSGCTGSLHNASLGDDGNPADSANTTSPNLTIFVSFLNLIHHLHKTNREFVIVFRSYGADTEAVLETLKQTRHIPEEIRENIVTSCGSIERRGDQVVMTWPSQSGEDPTTMTGHSDKQMYDHISKARGIYGLRDDFEHWRAQSYHWCSGKPFWVHLGDTKHHHIFFDDRIRRDKRSCIVDVRFVSDRDVDGTMHQKEPVISNNPSVGHSCNESVDGQVTDITRLAAPELDPFLVQVDLLEAINNEKYYIEQLQMCEKLFMESHLNISD